MSKSTTKKSSPKSRKAASKKPVARKMNEGFEPTKVSLAVSSLAVISLTLLALIAMQ